MKSGKQAISNNNNTYTKNIGPFLKTKFDNKTVSVKALGAPDTDGGNAAFANAGTTVVNTLTIRANTTPGETVIFNCKDFTVVSGNPTKEGEVKLGLTTRETAQNLATAMLNSSSNALKNYSITVNDADVVITQLSASATVIPITPSANITNVVTTPGTTGGLDVSGIKNITDFIETPTATFTSVTRVAGLTAKAEATKYLNPSAIAATANAGDTAAIYQVTIAGKKFMGSVFLANGVANINNLVGKFVHAETGESFSATFGAANGNDLRAGATTTAIATYLTNLFASTRFNQTQVLDINTDSGEVFDSTGSRISSLTGMTASLTSTSFVNKKFTDFTIDDAGGGNVTLTAKVMGPEGEATFSVTRTAGAQISAMVQGFKLDLTDSVSGDILTINLGAGGLTSLSDHKNFDSISWAFKSAILQTIPLKDNLNELVCDITKYIDGPDGTAKLLYIKPSKNSDEIQKFLLDAGVVFNTIYDQEGKITSYRCKSINTTLGIKLAEFLTKQGASVNHVNKQGQTALSIAAKLGQDELIKFLVTKMDKDLIEKTDNTGYTPLMYATANQDVSTFKTLVENGASPEKSLEATIIHYDKLINREEDSKPISEEPTLKVVIKNLVKWGNDSSLTLIKFGSTSGSHFLTDPKMAFVHNTLLIDKIAKSVSRKEKIEEKEAKIFVNLESMQLLAHRLNFYLNKNLPGKFDLDQYQTIWPEALIEFIQLSLQGVNIDDVHEFTTEAIKQQFITLAVFLVNYDSLLNDIDKTKILTCAINNRQTESANYLTEKVKFTHISFEKVTIKDVYDLMVKATQQRLIKFFMSSPIQLDNIHITQAVKTEILFLAINNYQTELAKYLIERWDISDCWGLYIDKLVSPLLASILSGQTELFKPLIKRGVDPFLFTPSSAWDSASLLPDDNVFSQLVKAVRECRSLSLQDADRTGFTPLMYAAKNQKYSQAKIFFGYKEKNINLSLIEAVKVCLDMTNADKHCKFSQGFLSLLFGNLEKTIKQLIIWGADPQAKHVTALSVEQAQYLDIKTPPIIHDRHLVSTLQFLNLKCVESFTLELLNNLLNLELERHPLDTCRKYLIAGKLANMVIKNEAIKGWFPLLSIPDLQQLFIERLKFYFSNNPTDLQKLNIYQYANNFPKELIDEIKIEVSKLEITDKKEVKIYENETVDVQICSPIDNEDEKKLTGNKSEIDED